MGQYTDPEEEDHHHHPHNKTTLFDPEVAAETAAETYLESAIAEADAETTDGIGIGIGIVESEDIRWLREQRLHHQSLGWLHKPTVVKICIALLICFVAMAVGISSKIILMLDVMCRHAKAEYGIEQCHDPKVQELTSSLQSKMLFVTGLTATLVSGKIGELSDRFGRKRVLVFMGCTMLASKLMNLHILNPETGYRPSLFIVSVVLDSLGGGTLGLLGVASSYVTDIVDPRDRIVSLGFSSGTLYAGLGFGPLLGSFLLRYTGNVSSTLYMDAFLGGVFLLFVIFFINESRSEKLRARSQSVHLQKRASFASQSSFSMYSATDNNNNNNSGSTSPTRATPITTLQLSPVKRSWSQIIPLWRLYDVFSPLKLLWLPKHETMGYIPRFNVICLVVIDALLVIPVVSITAPLILYVTYEFEWNSEMVSYFVSLAGVFKTITLYLAAPAFQHVVKKHIQQNSKTVDKIDILTIFVGTSFELLSPLLIILANTSFWIYASTMFSALSSMAAPTLQASIVKYISENQVGEVFGALSLIKNVLIMGAPSLFLFVYSHSVTQMPRLVFLMALVFIGASIVATLFLKVQPQHHQFGVKDAEEEEGSSRLVDYEIAGSPAQERQRQYSGGSGR